MDNHTNQPDPEHAEARGTAAPHHNRCRGTGHPTDESSTWQAQSAQRVQLPPGGRLLAAEEAIDLIVTGGHADSHTGSIAVDAVLIDALHEGSLIACQLADGRIAFTAAAPARTPPA